MAKTLTAEEFHEAVEKYKMNLEFDGAEGGCFWASSAMVKYEDIIEPGKTVKEAVAKFLDVVSKEPVNDGT